MNRRQFSLNSLVYLGSAISISTQKNYFAKKPAAKKRPPQLKKGDTIALIAPGSNIPEEKITKARQNLESLGFIVQEGNYIREHNGYLAGKDHERIADIHWAFSDKNIDGIWCVRGGYGCTRLLPFLDYKLIQKNPKFLIGYSDITALHMAILKKTGLTTFHGPVGSSEFTPYTTEQVRNIVFSPASTYAVNPYKPSQIEILSPGKAEGELIGGNLSLISAMCGTEYLPSAKGKIVFLEDIEEKPYRIDRMLVQLEQAWDLKKAKAVLLGEFVDCDSSSDRSLTLQETLENHFKDIGIPVMYKIPLGHIDNQATFPVGINAFIDTYKRSIAFTEKWNN